MGCGIASAVKTLVSLRSHLKGAGHAKVSCEALQALNPVLRERSRKT